MWKMFGPIPHRSIFVAAQDKNLNVSAVQLRCGLESAIHDSRMKTAYYTVRCYDHKVELHSRFVNGMF